VQLEHADTSYDDLVSRARDIVAALAAAGIDLGATGAVLDDRGEAPRMGGPHALYPLPALPEAAGVPRGRSEP